MKINVDFGLALTSPDALEDLGVRPSFKLT